MRKHVGLVTPQIINYIFIICKIINISQHILGQSVLQLSLFSDVHNGPSLRPQQD